MKPQTQHMITVLRSTIRGLGFTNREIERRLGVSRGYLTRLFSGVMDLRYDHISEIAEAAGIEPEEIFRLAYPPAPPKPAPPAVQRLRDTLGTADAAQPPARPEPAEGSEEGPSALERELERIVAKTFKKMFAGLEK